MSYLLETLGRGWIGRLSDAFHDRMHPAAPRDQAKLRELLDLDPHGFAPGFGAEKPHGFRQRDFQQFIGIRHRIHRRTNIIDLLKQISLG